MILHPEKLKTSNNNEGEQLKTLYFYAIKRTKFLFYQCSFSVKISLQFGNNVITTFIILSLFNCITNTYN